MKKYQIIYADPPWSYRGEMMNSSITDHYGVLSIENIKNLPVSKITSENSILFLWVTLPKLNEFMRVVESWEFEYKTTAFVWVKRNRISDSFFMGLGRWTRANPEICILATKGQISRQNKGIRQLQVHKIERHSKKPDIFRDLIVDLIGDLPHIELFAREKTEGWDSIGYEINGKDIRQELEELCSN